MKKFAATCLLLIYFTFSAGATVHLHFCMGKFVDASLFDTNDEDCGKCGMEKHEVGNNCCRDVEVSMKISDTHLSAHANHKLVQFSDLHDANYGFMIFRLSHLPVQVEPLTIDNSPPGDVHIELFIANRNLRI